MRAVKAARRDLSELSGRLVERIGELLPESVADSSAEYLRRDPSFVLPVLELVASAFCALCTEQPNDRPEVFTVFWMLKYMGTPEGLLQELDHYFSHVYHGLPSGGKKRVTVSDDRIAPPPGKPAATGRPTRQSISFAGPPPETGGVSPTATGICTDSGIAAKAPKPDNHDKEDDEEAKEARDQIVPLERATPRVSIQTGPAPRQSLRRGSMAARRSEVAASLSGGAGGILSAPPRHEVLRLLKAVPTMARFTEEDLDRVADIIKPCRYSPGETVAFAGEVSQALHIITEGSGSLSELQAMGTLGKGDFFGEQALLAGHQSPSVKQVKALDGGLNAISICQESFEALKIIRQVERRAKMTHSVQKEENVELELSKDALSQGELCPVTGHRLVKGYEQTPVDRTMIKEAIRKNDVLNEVMCLTAEQWDMIADSVHLIEVPSSMEVFRKGDIGNAFFIVQQGLLNIKLEGRGEIHFRLGDSFGELALMYDEPRSATVVSLTDSTRLWVMPRQPFRLICSVSAKQRLTEFANLLRLVPALASSIDDAHFELLAAVVEETVFVHRDEICVEGEDDGVLFMIYDGEARVIGTERHVKKGDFVGERQLIDQISADKTVIVVSEVAKVLILDRRSYEIALDASDATKANRQSIGAVKDTQAALDMAHQGSFKKQVQRVMTRLRSLTLFTDAGKTAATVKNQACNRPALERCGVVGKLGEGSFGLVLLVEDSETKKEFALKCLSKEHLNQENKTSMVQNERYVMMQLHSDFIVRLHRTYEDSVYYYLLLELATGGELFDVYTSRNLWGQIPYARFYIASVALGLSHMHAKRVVWRDLKLENCLVDNKGNLKLSDLGIAKLVIGRTYTVCGTADYFAPEALRQLGHNRGVDWWACGVLLFIMMAGRSPFDAPEVSQIYKNIIKGMAKVDFPASCPIDCANVIKALCKKKPEDRVTMQKGGVNNLMEMSFFKEFSWEDLSNRSMEPPYVPESSDYAQAAARKMVGVNLPMDLDTLREWNPDQRTEASRNSLAPQAAAADDD